jgi:hypothetical protein
MPLVATDPPHLRLKKRSGLLPVSVGEVEQIERHPRQYRGRCNARPDRGPPRLVERRGFHRYLAEAARVPGLVSARQARSLQVRHDGQHALDGSAPRGVSRRLPVSRRGQTFRAPARDPRRLAELTRRRLHPAAPKGGSGRICRRPGALGAASAAEPSPKINKGGLASQPEGRDVAAASAEVVVQLRLRHPIPDVAEEQR